MLTMVHQIYQSSISRLVMMWRKAKAYQKHYVSTTFAIDLSDRMRQKCSANVETEAHKSFSVHILSAVLSTNNRPSHSLKWHPKSKLCDQSLVVQSMGAYSTFRSFPYLGFCNSSSLAAALFTMAVEVAHNARHFISSRAIPRTGTIIQMRASDFTCQYEISQMGSELQILGVFDRKHDINQIDQNGLCSRLRIDPQQTISHISYYLTR